MEIDEKDYKMLLHHTEEGQNPVDVKKLYDVVKPVLFTGETVEGIYAQCKPFLRGGAIVTNWKLFLYQPRILGGAHFEDFWWCFLIRPRVVEHMLYSTFLVDLSERSGSPKTIGISWLPKPQALKLLYWARAQFRFWDDEWRVRDLQDARAKSGTLSLFPNMPSESPIDRLATPIEPNFKEPLEAGQSKPSLLPKAQPQQQPTMPYPYMMPGMQPMGQPSISTAIQPNQQQSVSLSIRLQKLAQETRPPAVGGAQAATMIEASGMHGLPASAKLPKAERLKQLKAMIDGGLISHEEYMSKRKDILSEM